MENPKTSMMILAFCFFNIAHQILMVNAASNNHHRLAPAIYVFGDSTVDAGNNNHLNTEAKANRWPYGIDFHNIRGRPTNGKNVADFAAMYLGVPLPPPYLNLTDSERSIIATGINYGSAACGILNTSRVGECLSLEQQICHFTSTVTKDLPKQMDQNQLHHHLAKSIFLISIGPNDYNDLVNHNITNRYSPPAFADYLLEELSKHIEEIYILGARKFVVNGISVCEPFEYTGNCSSRYYRDKLPEKLLFLQSKLVGSLFTIYDNYKVHKIITERHQTFGITNIQDPCYNHEENSVCPDRTKYYYFDAWKHITEVSCEIAMNGCFNGTICAPYTLLELARVQYH
ncbi:hypothetical protein K1719_028769 [Acacia pycnantha]|nr:hypothetical protein K1719_028769 [Acacia pycnantha]